MRKKIKSSTSAKREAFVWNGYSRSERTDRSAKEGERSFSDQSGRYDHGVR